jgi:hypothetical protein
MFPAKKAALVLTLVTLATAMSVASALAQAGPGNPSGGNALRLVTEETRGTSSATSLMSRSFSLPIAWQGIFGSLSASRVASFAPRGVDGRTQAWVARRPSAVR